MPSISLSTLRHLRALVATSAPTSAASLCLRAHRTARRIPHTVYKSNNQAALWTTNRNFASFTRNNEERQASSPPQTYYDLFPISLPSGPPPTGPFTLDPRALRKEFIQLQAKAHPDLHAAADKARAEATSAYINEAYKTLLNPLQRAQYLLSLRGVDVANDETAKVEDPELLLHVLELREQIEEAESEQEIAQMKDENEARIAQSEETLNRIFRHEGQTEEAKSEAVKLRYWVNVRESLDAWEKGKEVPPLVH